MRAVSEVGHLFSHFNSAKTSDRASRRCWASADATLRAHKPLSRPAVSAGSGSTWWRQSREHTISRTRAAAAFPRVIGGPGSDFIPAAGASWPRACLAGGLQASTSASCRRRRCRLEPVEDRPPRLHPRREGKPVIRAILLTIATRRRA
jgi:hypothetical protein